MLNPINLGAAFGLAKIQEKYIFSYRKAWISDGGMSDKKLYGFTVD